MSESGISEAALPLNRNAHVEYRTAGHFNKLASLSGEIREGDATMSEFYRAKLSELTMEFTRYLIQHPECNYSGLTQNSSILSGTERR